MTQAQRSVMDQQIKQFHEGKGKPFCDQSHQTRTRSKNVHTNKLFNQFFIYLREASRMLLVMFLWSVFSFGSMAPT